MKLNLCCGEGKLKDFVNIDKQALVQPDLVLDLTKEPYPYEDNSVDEIWLMHGIEHIEYKHWDFFFMEANRVLIPNGKFVLGYPEFTTCVNNYLNNKDGHRDFWVKTLYGRQAWPGDYHVVPCHSPELQRVIESYGFYRVKYSPEPGQEHDTVMVCFKDPSPMCRELAIAKELNLGDAISIEMLP